MCFYLFFGTGSKNSFLLAGMFIVIYQSFVVSNALQSDLDFAKQYFLRPLNIARTGAQGPGTRDSAARPIRCLDAVGFVLPAILTPTHMRFI